MSHFFDFIIKGKLNFELTGIPILVFVAGYKVGIFSNEFHINVFSSGILLTNLSSFLI